MLVIKNELYNAEEEIRELERLLNEAMWRKRVILKKKSMQGWWDWALEIMGY